MYIEIGFDEHAEIDEEEQLNQTLNNLRRLGVIDEHNLVAYNALIINPAYVHITQKSNDIVNCLRKKLADNDVYTIGRYGKWTYCSIEDCMLDAMKLAMDIKNGGNN